MSKQPTISPMVKKIAAERGIHPEELVGLTGSGRNGALTKADVIEFQARREQLDEPSLDGDSDGEEEIELMPPMDPDLEPPSAEIHLSEQDGREAGGHNPWTEAVEDAKDVLAEARKGAYDEKPVVTRQAKLNPMRHKRWKPNKYRLVKKRPGWCCRWVSKGNVSRYRGEGYSLATTRHYTWDGMNIGAQTSKGSGEKTAIIVNQKVLMEIPEEIAKSRREYYQTMAEANLLSPTAQAVASGEIQRIGQFGAARKRPAPVGGVKREHPTGQGFW